MESGLEANCNYLPLGPGSGLQGLMEAAQSIVSGVWNERGSGMGSRETRVLNSLDDFEPVARHP